MAMTYTTLTGDKTVAGSIKSWVNYSRVDAEGVLMDAQATLFQTLRVREMKAVSTLSVTAGVDYYDAPADLLTPVKLMNVTDGNEIHPKIWQDLEWMRSYTAGVLDTGDPCFYSIFEERLQFDYRTSSAFTGRFAYYKRPAALSGSNETNFLTTRYPHLLRTACLAIAAVHFHDDSSYAREMQRLGVLIGGVNTQDDLDDHYGQVIQG